MTALSIIAMILILLGLFFFFAGTVGILRLPDFYSRLHAAGKCDSLATTLVICGIAVYNLQPFSFGALLVSIKEGMDSEQGPLNRIAAINWRTVVLTEMGRLWAIVSRSSRIC